MQLSILKVSNEQLDLFLMDNLEALASVENSSGYAVVHQFDAGDEGVILDCWGNGNLKCEL